MQYALKMVCCSRGRPLLISTLSEASCVAVEALSTIASVAPAASSTCGRDGWPAHLASRCGQVGINAMPRERTISQENRIGFWMGLGLSQPSPLGAVSALPLSNTLGAHRLTSFRCFASSAGNPLPNGARGSDGANSVTEVVAPGEAARMVLEDPMSRLLASQGMPIGLSLRRGAENQSQRSSSSSRRGSQATDAGGSVEYSEGDGEAEEDVSKPPPAEPAYQMEAFSDMLRATAAAARRAGSSGEVGGGGDGGFTFGVQTVGPSLEDSWGTTRESPADIARRIVESNLEGKTGLPNTATPEDDEETDDEGSQLPMTLSPSEQKYASLEAMSADIKKMDEVFEVLASVPWLDEDVLTEKELKGVAQVGLLGTLEEVGFNIRPQLLRIWSGERGAELAVGPGLEFRDQAALLAILYHTQQIEDKFGPPPGGYLPETSPKS